MSQVSATASWNSRTALEKTVFLVILFAAVFFAPYLVRPELTISRSYVAGFSNRMAVALLVAGTALFALFTRGEPFLADGSDSRLSGGALGLGLMATLAACVVKCRGFTRIPGGECLYFLNRQQWMVAGRSLYRELEFGYGPLLIYPSLWTQRALHSSALVGYILAWIAESLLGVAMLWVAVRLLDAPVGSRTLLFWFLLSGQLVWLDYGGVNYTCFRDFAAAFAMMLTFAGWRRTRRPWLMALGSIASVLFCLGVSVEQAVGAALGLTVAMLLLVLDRRHSFPVAALAFAVAGSLACFAAADHRGMLLTFRTFSSGGYAYPVLPSPSIFLALFAYVIAGCALYRVLRLRRFDSMTIPLAAGGVAMLPAALGRSDILHIGGAGPLFLAGVAAILSMPRVRRWWLPLSWVFLVVVPLALIRADRLASAAERLPPPVSTWAKRLDTSLERSQNQTYVSAIKFSASALPCDRTYFSPSFMPMPFEPIRAGCLDTGYFDQFTNAATPQDIARKLDELEQHSSEPLLLEATALEDQIPLQFGNMSSLHSESGSLWVPPERNQPLTYAPLIEYIRSHYMPGPLIAQQRLRIWYPRFEQSR